MPSRDRLQRQLLELSIITFITVVVWIGYEVYTTLTMPVYTNVSAVELRVIPPPLNPEKFEPLRERFVIDEEVLSDFSPFSDEFPEIPVVPTPVPASPSSEATASGSTPD